ncbi:MAG: hypothetical protein Q7T44_01330 [Parvibaculum sp.]|nr:hypothetical protein [Parvibaculum sp.]
MTTTYIDAWRKSDPKLEAAATAFWTELNLLPEGATAAERLKELAVLAYDGATLIGVSTLKINFFDQLRQKFAFAREAIRPEYRLQSVGRDLMLATREVIEPYALAHPEEEIAGIGAIYQAPGIGKRGIGRKTRLALIGYTAKNEQVRIGWFSHFIVPPNLTPPKPRTGGGAE